MAAETTTPQTTPELVVKTDAQPTEKAEKRAFITFITNDKYVPGVRGLSIGLGRTKTQYPLVVLYTPAVTLSKLEEATSGDMNCKCILRATEVYKFNHTDGSPFHYWGDVYTKLRIWQQDDFDKLVYFDSDIMILKNVDELFDTPLANGRCEQYEVACASNCFHIPDNTKGQTCSYRIFLDDERKQEDTDPVYVKKYGTHTCPWNTYMGPKTKEELNQVHDGGREGGYQGQYFNSGMMTFVPSQHVFESMCRDLDGLCKRKPNGWQYVDQDFLNVYFQGRIRWMDVQYNCHKKIIRWHPRVIANAKVLHYVFSLKPWQHEQGTPGVYGSWMETDDLWWMIVNGESDEKVLEQARKCGIMHNMYSDELSEDKCRLGDALDREKYEPPMWLQKIHAEATTTDKTPCVACACKH